MKAASRKGFTLIEILIVVIILGILAAIVIPQFTNASKDAKYSSVTSTVQSVRSQVGLYALQHGDSLPDATSATNFWTALTSVTSGADGKPVGPYLQSIPQNPFTGQTALDQTTGTPSAASAWAFTNSKFYGYVSTGTAGSFYGD